MSEQLAIAEQNPIALASPRGYVLGVLLEDLKAADGQDGFMIRASEMKAIIAALEDRDRLRAVIREFLEAYTWPARDRNMLEVQLIALQNAKAALEGRDA